MERDEIIIRNIAKIGISTHTLTWSVTECLLVSQSFLLDFNSHAHVERDIAQLQAIQLYNDFNSHAHVERDGMYRSYPYLRCDFNSHAHVERDKGVGWKAK